MIGSIQTETEKGFSLLAHLVATSTENRVSMFANAVDLIEETLAPRAVEEFRRLLILSDRRGRLTNRQVGGII